MRLTFDRLSAGRRFPATRKRTKELIRLLVPAELQPRIARVHFGVNSRTTQEARIVERGNRYEIRINFWLDGSSSRFIAHKREWLGPIERLGGIVSSNPDRIEWPAGSAERYVFFLLAHEIAHILYAQARGRDRFGPRSGRAEEHWCDQWAEKTVVELLGA